MILRSFLVLLVLAVAPALRAQTILPSHFGAWSAGKSAQAAPATPETQGVLAESGLQDTESRLYTNGTTSITVSEYRFHDSSGAYEAYTYLFGPNSDAAGAPRNEGAGSATSVRFVRVGNILLVIDSPAALASTDLAALSPQVSAKADKIPPPPIPDYLPERDRIPGTEKYALGPAAFQAALTRLDRPGYSSITSAAGFSSGAEAMFARYRTTRDDAVLLLLEYPTPQLAGLHWKHLEQALPPSAKSEGTSIERKGSMLAIVLAPSSPNYATRVRNSVNYETQVTWNEPTHTITDPPITTVLAKIIMATGAFMLVAIVFGIAFGGVRVLMKAFFPGKVFDRPEQMDVLQLGLSSKRINSRDFY
jgi:hypothetical protein